MRTSHEATLGGKVQPLGSAQPERGVVYVGVCGLDLIGCLVAAVVRHWFFFIAALAARSAPSKSAPRRSPFKSRNGTSLICMYRALTQLGLDHVRLFGFDSFEGLPPDEEGHWGPGGRFKSELEFTRRVLAHEGVPNDRVVLIKGFFSDSLKPELITQYQITRASIIMVDVDMYRSTCEALQFCERLIAPEALLVFDDWHPLAEKNMGEKRAFDEFLQAHPSLHPTPYGSTYHWHAEAFWVTRSSKGAAKETTS